MFSNTFSRIFAASPFVKLQDHIELTDACVEALLPFIYAVINQDWQKAADAREKIEDLENQADELKRQIRSSLSKSLFMPVARGDVLELISYQDKIANRAKDISGIILGRKMSIPEPLTQIFVDFIKTGVDSVELTKQAILQLDDLVESGFSSKYTLSVEDLIAKLDKLEHSADQLQIEIRAQLLEIEKDLYPVDVVFLYKIIDWIGDLSDRALRVGDRIQILLAR